ncbi:heme biosynthesis HemY N-terminal domain-containing protein [Shewanella fodinae]|uniref:heme biosynthesis HemY N-terminal domain-containing protein n=1 Tax=Shewanella fodinae TaxID=552357 RepID=UPI001674D3A4|nr:heme biosynthesis HemY N-terminal domain-containing protein [Shewanella fodinae]MCL2907867.1 heme biosynthesis protein HemY [Shewanella fodinae]GGZ10873.1 heme biosynthesis protein HemY [Shewanella fodinae]
MIRALVYLLIILAGLCLSPFIVGKSGYVYIAFLDWQLETTVAFAVIAMVVFYGVLQLLEWLLVGLLHIILSSRYLPQRWRRNAARKHTLVGALALAEEDWPAAERAMRKGAEQGEIPALNYLAAARAAQYQQKIEARDAYLEKAATLPMAATAVTTTRIRYFLRQGEVTAARVLLDKLQPNSKSKVPVLKLATELYRLQQDWQSLKLLLPALAKRKVLSDDEWQQLSIAVNVELLRQAANISEQELEKCWQWLSRAERNEDANLAAYANGLNQHGKHDEAIKLLSKQLKKEASAPVFEATADIWQTEDADLMTLLQKLQPKLENHADYQLCMARIYERARDFAAAKEAWQMLCKLLPKAQYWRSLAALQEQLGDNGGALASYKQAVKNL